jgi:hypothetical protein
VYNVVLPVVTGNINGTFVAPIPHANIRAGVRPARVLSPKPRFSYLDLCCLDARPPMLTISDLPFLLF